MKEPSALYSPAYFRLLAAVILYMSGLSLQVHFGAYVAYRGGSASTLGWIMGLGMAGSLLARPWIGNWVDRLGTRTVLLGAAFTAAAAAFCFRLTADLLVLGGLQVIATLANALYFTAVAAHTAFLAPPHRRAESLGTMGMGGFSGMIIGPALGDWILAQGITPGAQFTVFFCTAALGHLAAAGLITTLDRPPQAAVDELEPLPFFRALRAHWPGMILLVGATFSLAQAIPVRFLERFAAAQGIPNIRNFYFGYAPMAIALRIIGRRVPERFGRRRTLVMGLVVMASGFLLLPTVRTEWQFFLPAIVMGAGHCFIYPSLIDLGAERFPIAQRGLGTSVILGAGDAGFLAGYICWGQLIAHRGFTFTFYTLAVWMLLVAAAYAWHERSALAHRSATPDQPQPAKSE